MLRIIINALLHLIFTIGAMFGFSKVANDNTKTIQEKYAYAHEKICGITKRLRMNVIVSGQENLPEQDGYLLCPNHQSRFDGVAVITACKRQISFLVDGTRADLAKLESDLLNIIGAKRLDKTSPRAMLTTINEISAEISSKKNFCIFLEGGHSDNKNTLQKFYSGALRIPYKVRCPIVPVCLYDVYKASESVFKKVDCYVDFLKPIMYEEYKDLSKAELAEVIKSRIQEKICQHGIDK